jgi:hypothetical protein
MRISRSAIVLFIAAFTASSLSIGRAETASSSSVVPRHLLFPVLLTKTIRVGGLGDAQEKKISLEVAQDVIVNHRIFAKKGDTVEAHYSNQKNFTSRVFSKNISEELALDVDDVINFCGDTIHLQYEHTLRGGARKSFMSFGAHVHDAVFDKGTVLLSRTDRIEKGVCSEHTDRNPLPAPQNGLAEDEN